MHANTTLCRDGRLPHAVTALVVIVLVALPGCRTMPAAEDPFEQHEVVIGSGVHLTVMSGFLLGGDVADLVVVNVGNDDARRVRIYAFDGGTWAPTVDATLHREVLFVDVADVGGRDRLITYRPAHLSWFDPETATERKLVAVTFNYEIACDGVPHVDVTRDVNGDERDDLVVPDADSFRVFIQMDEGQFADPVKLGPSTESLPTGGPDGYRYDPWDQGRIHEMDYNRDGRTDLVFWNEDHFEVHLQDERGRFTPVARTFTTEVAFDSDDPASIAAPQGIRYRRRDQMPNGAMTGSVLHSLTDMNGDGVADLAVFSLEIESMWSAHATYEVHFGMPTPDGGTEFAPDVGTAIRSGGVPLGMGLHDFDNDGQVDMMFSTIKIGVFKTLGMLAGALVTRTVPVDVDLYRMDGGNYTDKPDATRRGKSEVSTTSGEKSLHPCVLIGDVNGDGRSDMLVGRSRGELRVYLGVPCPDLLARRPQEVPVVMPADADFTWLADLNKDGRQDVLMHHQSDGEPNRVTMLIARGTEN